MADQKTIKRRTVRYSLALAVGSFAALALLWVMQFLIVTGKAAITERYDASFLEFVQVEKEETIERKQDKPERPPKPDEAPPDIPQDTDSSDFDSTVAVTAPRPELGLGLDSQLGDFGVAEGDYLPLSIVEPVYPRRAQSRGLEGYCILELTVTPLGTTADVRAVECSSSLFERSSIQAGEKFKYKPRVIDGNPIATPGVRYKLTYEIED